MSTTQEKKMVSPRSILKYFLALEQSEGVGAKVRRSIGVMNQRNFTPFLMLDHFNVQPPAGFPDHGHHGIHTITYVLDGMMAHEDFTGSKGILKPGDLQFMTAGKAIVHAEIPVQTEDNRACNGLQLWVDLPEEHRNCDPIYRDLKAKEIPIAKPNDNISVKVISGESYGVKSAHELALTPVHYYHFNVAPGAEFVQPFPKDFNVFLYLIKGGLEISGKDLKQHNAAFFKRDGDEVAGKVPSTQSSNSEFVIVGGQVLNQPVVQYGPFVDSSKEKIYETFVNYQSGTNGFERAVGWVSSIHDGVKEVDFEKKGLIEKEKVVKDEL